ncbi:MAG: nuclear transport factor 2 family protein [Candidatus Aquicultorales bacterium]
MAISAIFSTAGCGFFGGGPETAVDSFITSVERQDFEGAIEMIYPDLRDMLREVVSDFTTQGKEWAASGYSIRDSSIDGNTAVVNVEFVDGKKGAKVNDPVAFGTRQALTFYLVKQNGAWYIEAISE